MSGQEAEEKRSIRAKIRKNDDAFFWKRPSRCRAIAERLEAFPEFAQSQVVLTYVSLEEEVDTHEIIKRMIARGTRVLTPRASDDKKLQWSPIQSLRELVKGKFGVLEPSPEVKIVAVPNDAVALVPGLAFDRSGYRLGWGVGYYDRFLSEFNGVSIGLTFDHRLYDALPREPHDEPVDYIITESKFIARSNDT